MLSSLSRMANAPSWYGFQGILRNIWRFFSWVLASASVRGSDSNVFFSVHMHSPLVSFLRNFFVSSFLQVATDVAVRGLVIPNVDYVINYSYPYTAEDYAVRLNQSGRTGRKGIVHTFFTPAYQVGIHLDMNCQ